MNWRVTYRDKNSRQAHIFVDAENRTQLFRILEGKGIRPIRIEQSNVREMQRGKSNRNLILGGITVLITLVAIFFLLFSNNETVVKEKVVASPRPKVVSKARTPITKPKAQPVKTEKKVLTAEERKAGLDAIRQREYTGPVLDMDTYVSPDPGFSNRWERFKSEQAKLPFKHTSENAIAVILDTKPGQMILDGEFHPHFVRDFLKSLETPIIPLDSDDEKTAQLKRDMVQAKIILKEAYDRGDDIIELLKEERAQLIKIHSLRENLFRELKELEKSAKSLQEIDDYVTAANTMLNEYGAQHIKLPYSKERMRLEKTEGIIQ